jgi:hypothetical protein
LLRGEILVLLVSVAAQRPHLKHHEQHGQWNFRLAHPQSALLEAGELYTVGSEAGNHAGRAKLNHAWSDHQGEVGGASGEPERGDSPDASDYRAPPTERYGAAGHLAGEHHGGAAEAHPVEGDERAAPRLRSDALGQRAEHVEAAEDAEGDQPSRPESGGTDRDHRGDSIGLCPPASATLDWTWLEIGLAEGIVAGVHATIFTP